MTRTRTCCPIAERPGVRHSAGHRHDLIGRSTMARPRAQWRPHTRCLFR
jgi:hypothetical protein